MDGVFSNIFFNINHNNKILIEEEPNGISDKGIINKESDIELKTEIKPKKKYDSKKYNSTFYIKNNNKIKEKSICNLCGGNYTYYNKSAHNKTQKHIKVTNIMGIII